MITLKVRLGATMANTKAAVSRSKHIVDLQGRLYHDEAFVDFDEAAEAIGDLVDPPATMVNAAGDYVASFIVSRFNDGKDWLQRKLQSRPDSEAQR